MKLPEPVAEVLDHHARNQNNEITADLPCGTRLFTEAQLREALASHEAIMRMALEALQRMERYGNTFLYRRDEQNPHEQICEAIKALENALK